MSKVTYKGDAKSVMNQGYTLPRGEAVEMTDRHAARLFCNPKFDVKGLPKDKQPPKPEAGPEVDPEEADLGPEG